MVQLIRQYDRDQVSRESITIKVVGIGGAGSNILDRVMLDGINSAAMIAINTDVQSLTASVATQKVQLGRNLTRGLGLVGIPISVWRQRRKLPTRSALCSRAEP